MSIFLEKWGNRRRENKVIRREKRIINSQGFNREGHAVRHCETKKKNTFDHELSVIRFIKLT